MSTSQPPTETLVAALKGTERDSLLDLSKLPLLSLNVCGDSFSRKKGLRPFGAFGQRFQTLLDSGIHAHGEGFCHRLYTG